MAVRYRGGEARVLIIRAFARTVGAGSLRPDGLQAPCTPGARGSGRQRQPVQTAAIEMDA